MKCGLIPRTGSLLAVCIAWSTLAAVESSAQPGPDSATARSVVLVTMDGLRWQEVFGGAQEKLFDERAGGVRDMEGLKKRYLREAPDARREALMPFFWT